MHTASPDAAVLGEGEAERLADQGLGVLHVFGLAHLEYVAELVWGPWVLGNKAKETEACIDGGDGDASKSVGHGDLVACGVNHFDPFEAQQEDTRTCTRHVLL